MNQYLVRPAEIDDAKAIADVAKRSWHFTYGDIFPNDVIESFVSRAYSTESLTGTINRDQKRLARYFHVAENDTGKVIAFSQSVPTVEGDRSSFELMRIYALPENQGTGVGAALLRFLFQSAPNIEKLYAWVEEENEVGRGFYERHQFKKADEKIDILFGHETKLLKYQYVNDNNARPVDTVE